MKISVSILSSNNKVLSVEKLNNTTADYLHIDVMDGLFVENKAFDIDEIRELSTISKKKLDVHLMVNDPIKYIKELKISNVEFITFHIELNNKIDNIIKEIKAINKKVCLAINPDTNVNNLAPYFDQIDMILVMSVVPGKGGQKFIDKTLEKISQLKNSMPSNILIEVDGGINEQTIKLLNYVDIAVVGSFITNSENYQEQLNKLN